jgi:hypothetical protein
MVLLASVLVPIAQKNFPSVNKCIVMEIDYDRAPIRFHPVPELLCSHGSGPAQLWSDVNGNGSDIIAAVLQ